MNAGPRAQPPSVNILVVEDNRADVRLTETALRHAQVPHRLYVVGDGDAAVSFLHRRPPFDGAPRPALVLLDVNLPRKDGMEVLAEIKDSRALSSIPVIVLSTSARPADVQRAYELRANCYVVKPVDFGEFTEVVRSIDRFWLQVARLPDIP
ncbi:MAG: response regulator [Candidatus Dormibacteraeota bacterium]|nr:response regulator [Candidatus Dormibacteraeota bacterium]